MTAPLRLSTDDGFDGLSVTELRTRVRAHIKAHSLPIRGSAVVSARREDLLSLLRGEVSTLEDSTIAQGQSLDAVIRAIVRDEVSGMDLEATTAKTVLEVRFGDRPVVELEGTHHEALKPALTLIGRGEQNLFMVGPAGTGKTTLSHDIARALSVDFGFLSLSAGIGEHHLFGRVLPQADGSWKHVAARFCEIYQSGGVFLLDEIDAADPNLMVAINAALANGKMSNPVSGQVIERHRECIIVGAANTFGHGADRQYVGRNQLDAATLDRFTMATIFVDYSPAIESAICDNEQIIEWVAAVRKVIADHKLRRICSTRTLERAARHRTAGASMNEIKAAYFVSWSEDEKAKARAGGAL